MSARVDFRTALFAGGALAALLLGPAAATAQDQAAPAQASDAEQPAAPVIEGPQRPVSFADPALAIAVQAPASVEIAVAEGDTPRFQHPSMAPGVEGPEPRRLQLEFTAGGGDAPLDVSITQSAALGADGNGDLGRSGRGSELRVGQGLVGQRDGGRDRAVYMFVASDDEALTWQPGARGDMGANSAALALQEHVEVGDVSAGVTYERNGIQASLAYVEREASTRVGTQSFSQDESFTGVTLTMRR